MHNQQKVRPKSPYISKPKLRPSEKPQRQSRPPPSYTSHLQEYSQSDSLKPESPIKSRLSAKPPKPVSFYYFNLNSYTTVKESPKNLTTDPKSNENKDQAIKGNVLYTSYDMIPCGRILSRHNSTQKTKTSMTNISNLSGKVNTGFQGPESQNNFAQYIATVTKKVSNSIALQQHINRKHPSQISPTSPNMPNLPKAIKKQLVGTLSCMRPKNNSQENFESKSMLYPKPPFEGQKASNAFYENMKSYIQEHMDYQNSAGKISSITNMQENSRDMSINQSSIGSLGFQVKTSSLYKLSQSQQSPMKIENNREQSESESQNVRMRQALLRNLVEISSQATETEEKKITENDSPDPLLIPVKGFRNHFHGRPDSQRRKDASQPVKRWLVSPQMISGDYSSIMNRTGEQSQTWETEGVQTNISTTQETPRGLFRKKKMLKNMTTPKKPSETTSKQRHSTSGNRLSLKGSSSKQENDRSFSRHRLLKDKKEKKIDLWRNDSRGKVQGNEGKLPTNSSFVLSFHDGAALEKELTIQQGRLDAVEGWEPENDHATSPLAFDKLGIRDFSSLK